MSSQHKGFLRQGPAAVVLLALSLPVATAAADDGCADSIAALETALVRLAADRIDGVLGAVADSTKALGGAYAGLAAEDDQAAPEREPWLARRATQGGTTGFRTWPTELGPPPPFQASYAGFYSYRGEALDDALLRQLSLFQRLVPTFRSAYESFPFSWVYLTTADEAMMIYPYLPLEQAVNNGTPTENGYYKAADFDQRAVGWTPPYLDLVGAGMMITASYPVYAGDRLLGVSSRDITLKELARSVLSHLTDATGRSAVLIDPNGLAIDATDPALAAEIDQVNSEAGAAVLYFRTADGIKRLGTKDAVASQSAEVSSAVESLLSRAERTGDASVRVDVNGRRLLAARVERTGWLVILMEPRTPST
jgi:hypothetical protein